MSSRASSFSLLLPTVLTHVYMTLTKVTIPFIILLGIILKVERELLLVMIQGPHRGSLAWSRVDMDPQSPQLPLEDVRRKAWHLPQGPRATCLPSAQMMPAHQDRGAGRSSVTQTALDSGWISLKRPEKVSSCHNWLNSPSQACLSQPVCHKVGNSHGASFFEFMHHRFL